jgi:hypothetical protein
MTPDLTEAVHPLGKGMRGRVVVQFGKVYRKNS